MQNDFYGVLVSGIPKEDYQEVLHVIATAVRWDPNTKQYVGIDSDPNRIRALRDSQLEDAWEGHYGAQPDDAPDPATTYEIAVTLLVTVGEAIGKGAVEAIIKCVKEWWKKKHPSRKPGPIRRKKW